MFYFWLYVSGLIALEDGITDIEVTVPENTAVEWQNVQYSTGATITVSLDRRYRTALVSSLFGDLTGMLLVFLDACLLTCA